MKSLIPLALSALAVGTLGAQNAGAPKAAPADKLVSNLFDWEQLVVTPNAKGVRRAVFDGPTATVDKIHCHITTLNPGESPHAPHRHANEELMVVKAGTLAALQGDKTNIVTAGGIIFEASNELHGLKNIGTNQATYFVFKFDPHDLVK